MSKASKEARKAMNIGHAENIKWMKVLPLTCGELREQANLPELHLIMERNSVLRNLAAGKMVPNWRGDRRSRRNRIMKKKGDDKQAMTSCDVSSTRENVVNHPRKVVSAMNLR